MLHPSYFELMQKVNDGVEPGEEPVVSSRYSIVIAASKRARQIVESDNKDGYHRPPDKKPLSIAVNELYNGDFKIVSTDTDDINE